MKFPVLYSRTSKGQVQTWRIEVEGNRFRTHEGILDGKITTSLWTACEGKNIGKKNETEPNIQAEKEAASRHKKKLDSGYHEKPEDIDTAKFFEPMTAKKWKDEKKKVVFPVYSQPKLDGMRCVISKDGMFSRGGKPVHSAPHIFKIVKALLEKEPTLVLDGELYTHKFKKDFDKIISLAKQTKPTKEDLEKSEKDLQYWVYDCFLGPVPLLGFSARFSCLEPMINKLKSEKVKLVETVQCFNEEDLDEEYKKYLDDGFEGQMVRIDREYENTRSKYLLKRKTFQDKEFEITDIMDGNGNLKGIAASASLKTEEGILFDAGIIGSHEYAKWLYENRESIKGKMGTVIFQNFTPDGKPRFGKLKIVRDYE